MCRIVVVVSETVAAAVAVLGTLNTTTLTPDLTVTGKQCPRLLSGYQKARQEEQAILASLREEGFIATSRQKVGSSIAFEIVEATPATESASSKKLKPKVGDARILAALNVFSSVFIPPSFRFVHFQFYVIPFVFSTSMSIYSVNISIYLV